MTNSQFPTPAQQASVRIIDLILNHDEGVYGVSEDELQTLLDTAGDDLASHFVFAYCGQDESMPCWIITPKKYWDNEGYVYDQHTPIDHLLPADLGEAMEATWASVERDGENPLVLAAQLMAKGFVWDKDFQDFIDNETPEARKMISALTTPACHHKPPHKKP